MLHMLGRRTRLRGYEAIAKFERTLHPLTTGVQNTSTHAAWYAIRSKLQTHTHTYSYREPPTHPAIVVHPPPLHLTAKSTQAKHHPFKKKRSLL